MTGTPSPLERLIHPNLEGKSLEVWVKRDDLIHPHIMGNKWRKLKYNIEQAKKEGKTGLLTFGGAYSNHIAATAACANENSMKSIGVIRGDELNPESNPTLRFAARQGMEFKFVSREEFRVLKKEPDIFNQEFQDYYILPEGGTNHLAIAGCEEVVEEINTEFDYLLTALGTGGTMAGLLKGMKGNGELIGVSSLKGAFVHEEFRSLLEANNISYTNYQLLDNYHFGGYGKVTDELIDFINDFKSKTGIQLEPIYTGKMVFAFLDLVKKGIFKKNSKIILLHTGGLQGISGFNEKLGKKVFL